VARAEARRTVHCAHKANILKMTQGMMKRTFEAIAPEYPDIEALPIIMDNCAHQLVRKPEAFEVIVTSNLAGDILSDLTAGLVGGLGVAPAANLGNGIAMFEPVHGSAPDIAGQGLANPTAMLLSAVLMLRYLGQVAVAATVENAVLLTLEQATALTMDLAGAGGATTAAFTDAVVANLGKQSARWVARDHRPLVMPTQRTDMQSSYPQTRRVVGVDLFVESLKSAGELGQSLEALVADTPLRLKIISNRGSQVYPPTGGLQECVDHWRCRFVLRDEGAELTDAALFDLAARVAAHYRWMHVEKLQTFDGVAAYSKAQGEA
jgi:isocitrate dehydrogenase